MIEKTIWILTEIYEDDISQKEFNILATSFDKEVILQKAKELYQKDEYGYFAKYGVEDISPFFYESKWNPNGYVAYVVLLQEVI